MGWSDVVLLERRRLTCGTTWHAAGLLAQLRGSQTQTDLARYSIDLYQKLDGETGLATGVRRNGTLALARTHDRWTELKRRAAQATVYGIDTTLLEPREVNTYWELMQTRDLVGGMLIAGDGQGDPTGITLALAKAARQSGATIYENTCVESIEQDGSRGWLLDTTAGTLRCDVVVNCGGMWAPQLARMVGASVPLQPVEHMYIITEPMDGLHPGIPSVRDYDGSIYLKEDAGRLLMGGTEPNPKPWALDGIPDDFEFSLLNEDWDHFQFFMDQALSRIPKLESAGVRQLLVGPESFTPDGNYLLGEVPGKRDYFVAAGFNSIGIASAGGAGRALAEWIVAGEPTMDLSDVDIRRFHPMQGSSDYLRQRVMETVGASFEISWPYKQMVSARPLRSSALHQRLQERGACFGESAGWERPNWFNSTGRSIQVEYSFGKQGWFPQAAREHRSVREDVALFDLTSFSKFRVTGDDACSLLQRLCTRDIDIEPGRIIYTLMLNSKGRIECEATVTRIESCQFLVICGAANHSRFVHWMSRHKATGEDVTLHDVTSDFAVIGIMGPKSRNVLQSLTSVDLANEVFPFGASRMIELGTGQCRATRVTFVGELGWELYMPAGFAVSAYELLVDAGKDSNLVDAGYFALDSLRLECGYRHFGRDIGCDDSPREAGLDDFVDYSKTDFTGREALLRHNDERMKRRLMMFTMRDADPVLFGDEPIYRDGHPVGLLTSGAFIPTMNRSMGLGYVEIEDSQEAESILSGEYEIDIAGERAPASVHSDPSYDPGRRRVRS